jgi:hypothetical protein
MQRTPFEQQRQSMQAATQRSLGDTSGRAASVIGGREAGSSSGNGTVQPGGNQWHRFGEPSHSGNSGPQAAPQDGGWRRFGEPGSNRQMQEPSSARSPRTAPSSTPAYRPSERTAPSAPRSEPPARSNERPSRSDAGQRFSGGDGYQSSRAWGGQMNSPAPVRISPPIVRERAAPSYKAPRASAPSYSAPRGGGGSRPSAPSGGSRDSGHHGR